MATAAAPSGLTQAAHPHFSRISSSSGAAGWPSVNPRMCAPRRPGRPHATSSAASRVARRPTSRVSATTKIRRSPASSPTCRADPTPLGLAHAGPFFTSDGSPWPALPRRACRTFHCFFFCQVRRQGAATGRTRLLYAVDSPATSSSSLPRRRQDVRPTTADRSDRDTPTDGARSRRQEEHGDTLADDGARACARWCAVWCGSN